MLSYVISASERIVAGTRANSYSLTLGESGLGTCLPNMDHHPFIYPAVTFVDQW
jgi:hypothetical protein